MKNLLAACCISMGIAGQAAGEEILHCSDTDAIGFQWQDGRPQPVRYVPAHFIVKVISETERVIVAPSQEYRYDRYRCRKLDEPKGALACIRPGAASRFPVNFNGRDYERVGNMSAPVGGKPDLYVAYGRCIEF